MYRTTKYNLNFSKTRRKVGYDKKKRDKKIVLNFILSLNSEFSFPLQKNLAKLFELSYEFDIIV